MFQDLSAQRLFNQAGVQSVQISEIESYLNIKCEQRKEYREVYLRIMLDMDTVFMDYVRKKMEKNK